MTTSGSPPAAPPSAVPAADLAELAAIVEHTLSPDNSARQAAEDALLKNWRQVPQRVPVLIAALAELVHSNPSVAIRSVSAVLLRRIGLKPTPGAPETSEEEISVWSQLDQNVREYVQAGLLQSLSKEPEQSVRHKICDAVAEISVENSYREYTWPQLLPVVLECVHSQSPQLRESALRIISSAAGIFLDTPVDPQLVSRAFSENLQFPDDSVKTGAVEACVSFIMAALMENPKMTDQFSLLMQQVLQAVVPMQDEDKLSSCLSALTDLAQERPRLFQKHLAELVEYVNSLMVAAELVITLAVEQPKMIKKKPQLSHDDDDNDENYVYAEQAIDRLALALADWRQRHAGLMAISVLGEGCVDLMQEKLADIVKLVVPYLRDAHTRVRYAACNAVGQLCTDFAPKIQNENGQVILENLVPLMDDATNPRIQAHSAAALVNFMEEADKYRVAPVAGEILPRLVLLLKSSKIYIQEQAVTTIATVADCIEENFIPYCATIVPVLLEILRDAVDVKYRLLRGKTLECITLVGLAVKEEAFAPYVDTLLQFLQQIQQTQREDDDPVTSYLLVAWARVCKIIGQKFVPFLPLVVPPLLEAAAVKPEVTILDGDEDLDAFPADEGWDFVKLGDQRLGIKTAVVDDKRTAVEMICTYANDLEASFAPFVDSSLNCTLPLIGFVFDLGVRQAAARAVPLLLNCLKLANADNMQILQYWSTVKEKLFDRIITDHDTEYLSDLYIAFYTCVKYLGRDFLTADLMEKLVKAAEVNLNQLIRRSTDRKDADEDEPDVEEDEADDENLLIEIANAVHAFFMVGEQAFLPYFERLAQMFSQFLHSEEDTAFHFGLSVFGDLIDYGGPQAPKFAEHLRVFPRFVVGLSHTNPDIRQASAYCVGVCAQRFPRELGAACVGALPLLGAMILAPTAREPANTMATENAVSAVGKICHFVGADAAVAAAAGLDVAQALPHWIDALPILYDNEESEHAYGFLLSLLEANNATVMGKLPFVGSVLARALLSDLDFSDELKPRLVSALKTIITTCQLNPFDLVDQERQPFLQQLLA
ncbi:hypothetical protein HK405_002894 [Cladochytrium tenue]|nr:hypothetical protein HK405_002894 [Cladochytrium tenue]